MLHGERMSMLTGLKMPSLVCKCVFCRPEQIAKNFKMQKSNIPMDRPWRVDDKNGVIYLVIMFTPGVMIIKMSKNGSFFVFSADYSPKSVTVWGKQLSSSERSYLALFENADELLSSELPLAKCQPLKSLIRCQPLKRQDFGIFQLTQQIFLYSYPENLNFICS